MSSPGITDINKPSRRLIPYLVMAIATIIAYLPVSSMLFTLRNDVLVIEYPIQHFMSESIRNGDLPIWFNTWAMGFPLQSILSWGVFSTPRMLTGLLFHSNIYILHAEFLFYIMTSGWCMYKLLKTHFIADRNLSLLLSCCYMLSGFTVGSSQWLLYITGMTFTPLLAYCLLCLLKKPGLKYSLLLAVSWYLFFTNVHIYLTLVATYLLLAFLILYFSRSFLIAGFDQSLRTRQVKFLSLAFFLLVVLCVAPIYYSIELITHLGRSAALADNQDFFRSNYLHPDALSSLLLPLSSVKTNHFNTEGTVLDSYLGLLPLILLPASIFLNSKSKGRSAFILLGFALLVLLVSFGHLTPFRKWMNILPGMSHFRHPGVLRIFFNFLFILYLGISFKNHSLQSLLHKGYLRKSIIATTLILLVLSFVSLLWHAGNTNRIWKGSLYASLKEITAAELWLISSLIQVIVIVILAWLLVKRQRFVTGFLLAELVLNTLTCTPFFTVSTYSANSVNRILASTRGFPVQEQSPSAVPAAITDERHTTWYNVNTFRKQVSNHIAMQGPLIIEDVSQFLETDSLKQRLANRGLVFIPDSTNAADIVEVVEQRAAKVRARVSLTAAKEIVLQQAMFPGWKAYYNDKRLALIDKTNHPFVSAVIPAGEGTLIFEFEKRGVTYSSILLHLVILTILVSHGIRKIRRRSSSPLSSHEDISVR